MWSATVIPSRGALIAGIVRILRCVAPNARQDSTCLRQTSGSPLLMLTAPSSPNVLGSRPAAFIDGWYNTRRLHSALDYTSPADYERLKLPPNLAAPAA